jgi:hypothetical protein
MNGPTRRELLGTLAGSAGLALAGCVGGSGDEPDDTEDDDSDDGSGTGEPDQLQSRFPDEEFPEDCPEYGGVDRVICYDAVDSETVPAVLEPSTRTIEASESIDFTLHNRSDLALKTNFYNWRIHKRVDGDWYRVAPRGYNEPLMTVSPGESHTWTVSIDNDGIADGESIPWMSGTEQLTLRGVGGGHYAFRARGWFADESYEESIAFAATFEFDGPPIELTTTNSIEGVGWEDETLVATSSRGDPDNEYSKRGAFELERLDEAGSEAETVITEQILRQPQLRDTIALAAEHDADRVRLEEYNGVTPIFGSRSDKIYEFQGSYYEVTTSVIEE